MFEMSKFKEITKDEKLQKNSIIMLELSSPGTYQRSCLYLLPNFHKLLFFLPKMKIEK